MAKFTPKAPNALNPKSFAVPAKSAAAKPMATPAKVKPPFKPKFPGK